MTFETFNIFPTTLYVGKMLDHEKYKEEFYKVYPRYDYEETDIDNTVSENLGKPFIHLEDSLDTLFNEIAIHSKKYVCDVLEYKDIFNYFQRILPEYHLKIRHLWLLGIGLRKRIQKKFMNFF